MNAESCVFDLNGMAHGIMTDGGFIPLHGPEDTPLRILTDGTADLEDLELRFGREIQPVPLDTVDTNIASAFNLTMQRLRSALAVDKQDCSFDGIPLSQIIDHVATTERIYCELRALFPEVAPAILSDEIN